MTQPDSYRFQVLQCLHHCDGLGNSMNEYGRVLWEEPPGREITWEMPQRVAAAWSRASELANSARHRVAVGRKDLMSDGAFTPDYFVDYPAPKLTAELCLDQARDAIQLARETMRRAPNHQMAAVDYKVASRYLEEAGRFMLKAAGCAAEETKSENPIV